MEVNNIKIINVEKMDELTVEQADAFLDEIFGKPKPAERVDYSISMISDSTHTMLASVQQELQGLSDTRECIRWKLKFLNIQQEQEIFFKNRNDRVRVLGYLAWHLSALIFIYQRRKFSDMKIYTVVLATTTEFCVHAKKEVSVLDMQRICEWMLAKLPNPYTLDYQVRETLLDSDKVCQMFNMF